ncbi:hypothetical protein SPFL3102_00086 [Sporomusaceae bacterium FL31]|nr:hypothetical protein SPFL3101_02497 [Sporomusaceae bacterium FL31]GCE32321.1 hypothetical protein SPFL3102_00086 [Sporomusaceae bacterium]
MKCLLRNMFQDKAVFRQVDYYSFLVHTLIYGAAVGLNSILIPAYALELNASIIEVGLIVGSRGIGHFALVVPVGFFLERFGAKKIFLVSSLLEAFFVLAIFFVNTPMLLLLFATLDGFMCSTRLTVLNAAFLHLLPQIDPVRNGWYKASMTTGLMLVGPLVGGMLATQIGLAAAFLFNAVWILAGIALLVLLPTQFLMMQHKRETAGNYLNNFIKILRDRTVLLVAAGETLTTGYMSSFRTLVILVIVGLLKRPVDIVSAVVLMSGAANIITTFAGPVLLKDYQAKTYYHITVLIMVPTLLLLSFGDQDWMLYAGACLSGLGMGVMSLANYRIMGRIRGERGLIAGVFTFSAGFSMAVAPMISSFLADYFGVRLAFVAYIIPFLVLESALPIYRTRVSSWDLAKKEAI